MKKLLDRIKEDVLIIDKKGKICYCNQKLVGKLHYHSKFMSGLEMEKIFAEPEALNQILVHVQTGEEIVLRLKTKEGEMLKYVCKVVERTWEYIPAFVLVGQVQEDYPIPSLSMRQILDQIPSSILVKGIDGKYNYINQVGLKKIGIKKDQIIGKTNCQIWGEKRGSEIEEEDDIILKTHEPQQVEGRSYIREQKLFKVYKFPFYREKQVAGIIKIFKDETLDWVLEQQQDENDEELLRAGDNIYGREYALNQDSQEVKVEQCLLREFEAQGVNVFAYDDEQQQFINYFDEGVCKKIVQQDKTRCIPADNFSTLVQDERYQGVHPIEKSVFIKTPQRFLARGIKDVGVYPIYYDQEFMGILTVLYEAYDYANKHKQRLDKNICKQLGFILKQFQLSRKLKEELERRRLVEEELGHLLDTAGDIIQVVNVQQQIQMVSQSFCELVGKPKEEIIGRHYKEFIHTEGGQIGKSEDESVLLRYINQRHKWVWIEWRVRYNAQKGMYVCIGTDLTKAKELAQQQEDYERRVQKEAVRNEFFTKISHEFRTPINMVLASLELINQLPMEPNTQEVLSQMRRKSYRLLELVNDLIDMTEIDAGFAQLQLEQYNLIEVVETVTEAINKRIKLKAIQLIFDTQIEELQICCDRIKIERTIGSLIGNAVRRIQCEGSIQVEVKLAKDKVKVCITDTGKSVQGEEFFVAQSFVGMHGGRVFISAASDGENITCIELPLKVEGNYR